MKKNIDNIKNNSTVKISVITVCYNVQDQLAATMDSVVGQSYADIEYLIIDGVSEDGTCGIAHSYADKYDYIDVVSEPDKGVYDAMNKGAGMCSGDYVVFLNAGDKFADSYVIADTVKHIEKYAADGCGCDIIYGDYYDGTGEQENLVSYGHQVVNTAFMLLSNTICHQAIFSSRRYLIEHPFDITYKYVADRKWLSECIKAHAVFQYMNRPVVIYDRTGMSTDMENRSRLRSEVDRYIEQMYPVRGKFINAIKKNERLRAFARKTLKGKKDRQ